MKQTSRDFYRSGEGGAFGLICLAIASVGQQFGVKESATEQVLAEICGQKVYA